MILDMIMSFLQSNAGKSLEASAVNSLTYLVDAAIKHHADVHPASPAAAVVPATV